MATKNYTVTGMTCQHCVNAVTEEVSAVAGIEDLNVNLADGRLSVTGEGFTDADIVAAVEEAGYKVVQ